MCKEIDDTLMYVFDFEGVSSFVQELFIIGVGYLSFMYDSHGCR
jgi:hypothetical protein